MYRYNRQVQDGNFQGRRRFRGQYFRTRARSNSNGGNNNPYPEDQNNMVGSGAMSPPRNYQQQHQQHHLHHQHQQPTHQQQQQHQHQQPSRMQQHRNSFQQDIEDIKSICSRLAQEFSAIKDRVDDIAANLDQIKQQQQLQIQQYSQRQEPNHQNPLPVSAAGPGSGGQALANSDKRRKPKLLKKREAKLSDSAENKPSTVTNKEPNNLDKQRNVGKRNFNKEKSSKPIPTKLNDDSTTQAADPSSEDKAEGDDVTDRVRVFRRKKPHFYRRGPYSQRRRRVDSSERNSNDTSPQNELNGDDYRSKQQTKNRTAPKKTFRELSEAELNEVTQNLKRDFLAAEIASVKKTIDEKGPVVAKEFAASILDHAICDVTSPTKLSDIANNLFHILISDNGGVEFQQGFYSALNDISKREDDIAIDAPRYMDTLGQVLGQCIVPMNSTRHKQLLRRFLNKSLQAYSQQSRALLLASIMRGIANHKSGRFAKDVWDVANLKWDAFLNDGTNLDEFLESQTVAFTMQQFSPEPEKPKRKPEEMEKFADDVTDLVEKRCTTEALDDLIKDLELEPEERVEFMGTLVYAIVRGCLSTDSGDYKLETGAIEKYSTLLDVKHLTSQDGVSKQDQKKELDAIALHALTALTKLWHQLNCPQNLICIIIIALHVQGTASLEALLKWLNSDDLKNIPGIGAARLISKRCIENLVATGTSTATAPATTSHN